MICVDIFRENVESVTVNQSEVSAFKPPVVEAIRPPTPALSSIATEQGESISDVVSNATESIDGGKQLGTVTPSESRSSTPTDGMMGLDGEETGMRVSMLIENVLFF